MDSLDPLVSCLLVFFFLCTSILLGLAEQYFLSLNENKLEYAAKQGLKSAGILQSITKRKGPLLGDTIWLGKLTSLFLLGFSLYHFFFRVTFKPSFGYPLFLFAALFCGALLSVVPRFLQLRFKRKYIGQLFFSLQIGTYYLFAIPTFFTVSLIRLICGRISPSANAISLLVPLKAPKSVQSNGTNGAVDKPETEVTLLQNALDFSKVKARDCMVPRNEIVAIDIDSEISVLKQKFVETHFSKILVYKDTSDNLVGYVHSHELFKKPTSIKSILLPVFQVPETINAQEVFEQFVKQKRSIAVVVDEFGGTSGMVTVEDVMEEIFGEIDDEHDTSDLIEERPAADHYIFSGRLEIDYLNEKYNLNIPDSEEYDTLAGFIVHQLEDIPEANACFETEQFLITVSKVSDARIELIDLKVKVV